MLATVKAQATDCVVVDGQSAAALNAISRAVSARQTFGRLPVIVWDAEHRLEQRAAKAYDGLTVRHVHSRERLLDLVTFFLHRRVTRLPEIQHRLLAGLHQSDAALEGRKALIVDDDIRNIFALTSVLEREQMNVVPAETGQGAIELLQAHTDVDIVLMDIMMPGMDGYETMRAIRRMPKLRHLPIIAVTAKAMKGDREKTIEAGAWDYLSKPVDSTQMLSVMRAWLQR
jgi:CheY-like chemotaxis protein